MVKLFGLKKGFSMKRLVLLTACLFVATLHTTSMVAKGKNKTTVSDKSALAAATSAAKLPAQITALASSLDTASTQFNTAQTATAATDYATSLTNLNALLKSLESLVKPAKAALKTAQATSKTIPPLSLEQEKTILTNDIAALNKTLATYTQSGTAVPADLSQRSTDLKQQLDRINQLIVEQKKAAKDAAKNYVIFSNAVGGRLKIYGAPKTNPTKFKRVKTIKKNKSSYLLACHPDYVYKLEIENQNGKINKKGKIVYHYRTMNRHGSKTNTFSVADRGHQIIVDNYHQYSVHTLSYAGKGSIKQQKIQNIAILVTSCVVIALLIVATGGAAAALAPELVGAEVTGTTAVTIGATVETAGEATTAASYALVTAQDAAIVGVGMTSQNIANANTKTSAPATNGAALPGSATGTTAATGAAAQTDDAS